MTTPAPQLDMMTAVLAKACPGIVGISIPDPDDKTTWIIWRNGSPAIRAIDDPCANAMINAKSVAAVLSMPAPIGGLTIVSISNPVLNGVYAVDDQARQSAAVILTYIMLRGRFPAGLTSFAWPDKTGVMHQGFTIAQFQALASSIEDYAVAIGIAQAAVVSGTVSAWPVPTATIL